MQSWLRYILIAVVAWAVVDFTTTAAVRHPVAYYGKYMPALLIFYIGYPLVFSALIYKVKLGKRSLFFAMVAGILLVEIVCTHNLLLLTPPICLIAIPIGLGHYSMVSFMPLWLAEESIGENRKWVVATLSLWAVGVVLNVLTQFGRTQ